MRDKTYKYMYADRIRSDIKERPGKSHEFVTYFGFTLTNDGKEFLFKINKGKAPATNYCRCQSAGKIKSSFLNPRLKTSSVVVNIVTLSHSTWRVSHTYWLDKCSIPCEAYYRIRTIPLYTTLITTLIFNFIDNQI